VECIHCLCNLEKTSHSLSEVNGPLSLCAFAIFSPIPLANK
jgi:hypothetical protein